MNFGPLFGQHKFLIAGISDTSCRIATKFCMVRGLTGYHKRYYNYGVIKIIVVVAVMADIHSRADTE